jgi:hypothetical protein
MHNGERHPKTRQKLQAPLSMNKYSIQDKMNGADLHGLSCRVPKPTEKQSKCSHTKFTQIDKGFSDWWTNEWISHFQNVEVDTFEDIPNTNNLRCSLCGYTRRY